MHVWAPVAVAAAVDTYLHQHEVVEAAVHHQAQGAGRRLPAWALPVPAPAAAPLLLLFVLMLPLETPLLLPVLPLLPAEAD